MSVLLVWGLALLGFFGLVASALRRFPLFLMLATSGAWTLLTAYLLDFGDKIALAEQPFFSSLLLVGGIAVTVILGQTAINRFVNGLFAVFAITLPFSLCFGPAFPLVAFLGGVAGGILAIRTGEAQHFSAGASCILCAAPAMTWFADRVFGGGDFVFAGPIVWVFALLAGYATYQQARHQGLFSQVDNESPRTHSTLE